MDVNYGRRLTLAIGSVGAAAAGLAVLAAPEEKGFAGLTELAYAVAFVPPVLGVVAAATGRARIVVLVLGVAYNVLAMLFTPLRLGFVIFPAAFLLAWAGALPAERSERTEL